MPLALPPNKKRPKRVLVVDDDLALVKLLQENLRSEGYTVYTGYDGHMAVNLAQSHQPDLILMDVNMPYMDGLKAFEKLRADEATSRIPVIFISAIQSEVIYPIVNSAPRAAHLKKPLDLVDLNSLLRQFILRYAA